MKENICIEDPILKFLNNAAVSFPKNWGEASTMPFDVSKKRNEAMEETQMKVTQVMSTMYYHIPLLGHHTAELHAVQFAAGLCTILHKASIWYRRQATVLQVIIRVLILTACTVSLITPRPATVGDGEDQPKNIFSTLNILLPIGVAVMTSVFGLYKPMDKFVATFTAEKLIESEIYRYCTRTGIYKPNRIQCRHHREQFARQCEKIWQDLSVSGAVVGVKCLGGQRVSDLKQGSNRNVIHVEPPLNFLPLEHRETPTRTSPEPHDHENNINDVENAEGRASGNAKEPAPDTTTQQKSGDTKDPKPYKPDIPLLGSKYLEKRIDYEIEIIEGKPPKYTVVHCTVQFVVVAISAAGGVMAYFDVSLWLPLLLAVSAVLEFWINYSATDVQVANLQATMASLTKLKMWWLGLSPVQQWMPTFQEHLVQSGEEAIIHMHNAYVQGAMRLVAPPNTMTDDRQPQPS